MYIYLTILEKTEHVAKKCQNRDINIIMLYIHVHFTTHLYNFSGYMFQNNIVAEHHSYFQYAGMP